MNEFTRLNNTNSLGGQEQNDANTVDACKMACNSNTACLAIDFDAAQPDGSK